ncbi:hypothetical protein KQX54_005014 [Cotesia glomerata]|uniref:USP domain-containing protein n=2 Tax=Cotesia glomerata TaxID=32391 RepID=A0AAV7J1R3_COTGL|nr:hypothetical protein KQX54_005014 [Cotesia glomerata]
MEERVNRIDSDLDHEKQNELSDNLNESSVEIEKISSWLCLVENYSLTVIQKGTKLNCFYLPNLSLPFKEKLKEFPLWTKACIKYTTSRASSSYIEENFKDLKMMLHKQISLPSRVDIFMKAHLKILIGGIKIFQAKLAKFMDEMANIQTNLDDDDVGSENIDEKFQNESCYENWMGFGKDPKHQKFNWVNSDNSSKINKNNENLKDENLNDENLNDENLNDEDLNYQSISETNENNLDMSDTKESSIITSNLNDSIAKDHSYHLSSSPLVEIKIEKLDPVIINQEKKNKHEGKYFKPCPDIKLINDGIVKKIESGKKGNNIIIRKNTKIIRNLLLNGNVSGPIKIGNDSWFAFNTCPFDSIAQLIYSAALENPKFFNFLKISQNKTFLFVADFLSTGLMQETCTTIYSKRFEILYPLYKDSDVNETHIINCFDNVNPLWQKLFHDEPSVFEVYLCLSPSCEGYKRNAQNLAVNYNKLVDPILKSLEKSIIFEGISKGLYCHKCTHQSKRYKLKNFPKHKNLLEKNLLGEQKQLNYRLSGVIGYQDKHYIAYCQNLSGSWQYFNDSLAPPKGINSSIDVTPHGVLYILNPNSA